MGSHLVTVRGHRRPHPHPRLPKVAPAEGQAKVTRGLARLSHRPGSHVVPAQCEPGEGTEAAILYLICPTATLSVRPLTAGGDQAWRSGPKPGFSPAQSAPRPPLLCWNPPDSWLPHQLLNRYRYKGSSRSQQCFPGTTRPSTHQSPIMCPSAHLYNPIHLPIHHPSSAQYQLLG